MKTVVYDIALRVGFRGLTRRTGIIFQGPAGWAEWSPFPEYDDVEAASWLRAANEAAQLGYPQALRSSIPVNGIVPALSPAAAAQRAIESGCDTIKIKVAAPQDQLTDDLARVAAVRQALPTAKLRVDANGGWSFADAKTALAELEEFGLEYVEQPCPDISELAQLRRLDFNTPIAADESIRRVDDPMRVRRAGAADIAILKVQPLGGVRNCLALAEALKLPVVVSSAIETSVGLAAGVALAAALPELRYACGLETGRLLAGDVTSEPLLPVAGELSVGEVEPDLELLLGASAGPEVEAWWLARLSRVSKIVEAGR